MKYNETNFKKVYKIGKTCHVQSRTWCGMFISQPVDSNCNRLQMATAITVAATAAASTKLSVHLIGAGMDDETFLVIDQGWTLDHFKSVAYKTVFGTRPPPPSAIALYFYVAHGQRKLITIPRFARFRARGRQPHCTYVFVTRGNGAGDGGGNAPAQVTSPPIIGGGAGQGNGGGGGATAAIQAN
jgi:hypothetical protein